MGPCGSRWRPLLHTSIKIMNFCVQGGLHIFYAKFCIGEEGGKETGDAFDNTIKEFVPCSEIIVSETIYEETDLPSAYCNNSCPSTDVSGIWRLMGHGYVSHGKYYQHLWDFCVDLQVSLQAYLSSLMNSPPFYQRLRST